MKPYHYIITLDRPAQTVHEVQQTDIPPGSILTLSSGKHGLDQNRL